MDKMSIISSLLAIPESSFTAGESTYTIYRTVSLVFIILMLVAAIAAIVLVMLQPGNSQGIEALGGSSETFYGKNKGKSTESVLKKWTFICLAVLTVFSIIFFILQIPQVWGLPG